MRRWASAGIGGQGVRRSGERGAPAGTVAGSLVGGPVLRPAETHQGGRNDERQRRKRPTPDEAKDAYVRERLGTPTDLKAEATRDISAALAGLLADVFALYVKTKNFHWHMSGPHFRDYHLLFDEHGDQIFAMTDPIAERARKIGGTTIRSIGDISGAAAHSRQRRRLCRSEGHAGGTA